MIIINDKRTQLLMKMLSSPCGTSYLVRHRSRPRSPHRALAHGPLETFTQDVANFERLNPKHKLVRKD